MTGKQIVAQQVWTEKHFVYTCPSCKTVNKAAATGESGSTIATCRTCEKVMHIREPQPQRRVG